jgi:hypothetical protein
MEAIKQIVRTPENHEIRIKLPSHFQANEMVEIIVFSLETPQTEFEKNINALKTAMHDNLFLQDLQEIGRDFDAVDGEGWEEV